MKEINVNLKDSAWSGDIHLNIQNEDGDKSNDVCDCGAILHHTATKFKCLDFDCMNLLCEHCDSRLAAKFSDPPKIDYSGLCSKTIEEIEQSRYEWEEYYHKFLPLCENDDENHKYYMNALSLPIFISEGRFEWYDFEVKSQPEWVDYFQTKKSLFIEIEEEEKLLLEEERVSRMNLKEKTRIERFTVKSFEAKNLANKFFRRKPVFIIKNNLYKRTNGRIFDEYRISDKEGLEDDEEIIETIYPDPYLKIIWNSLVGLFAKNG